jgi:hypothetical protein
MRLKSFGCSFIYGFEMADTIGTSGNLVPSQSSYPALLAKHIGYEYKCFAQCGSGNLAILEKILSQIAVSDKTDIFVISWSWIDRYDYYNSIASPVTIEKGEWTIMTPGDQNKLAQTYYRELHSEYRDKLTSLSYIKLAIDTLNQHGIQFIMTYMDNLIVDQRWNTTPAVLLLQSQVTPYLTTFDGKTFLDWSRDHGYKESAQWHPLEEAHSSAADYMIKVFDTQKTNGLTQ